MSRSFVLNSQVFISLCIFTFLPVFLTLMGRTYTLFNLDQMTGFYFYLSWITVFAVLCHPESLYSAFSYSVSFILFNELQNLEVSHFRALVSRRNMYARAIPTVITPGTLRLVCTQTTNRGNTINICIKLSTLVKSLWKAK